MKKLIFTLSEYESIEIKTEDNIDFNTVDFCCTEIQAHLFNIKVQQFCIGEETAGAFFIALIGNLKKAVTNNLQLHESLKQNLGLMYNQYCHEMPHQTPEFIMAVTSDGTSKYWVGVDYKIWSTYNTTTPKLTTWLYNDHTGNIIFEVNPLYKWSFFPDDLQDPEFLTYDEFMKDYKPLIHRIIPRDVAIEWLEQAIKVYKGIFSSEEDYIRACKENNW
jgi:hypothetical protein